MAWLILSSATFASIGSFIVTFVKTTGAYAAVSTMLGTSIGFVAGAYIPVGLLPAGVVTVLNALPFAHAGILLRRPYTAESLETVTAGPGQAEGTAALSSFYGIDASVGDIAITTPIAAAALVVVTVVFAMLGVWHLARIIR